MGKKLVIKGANFHSNSAVSFFELTKSFGVGVLDSNVVNGYKKRVALFYNHIDNVLPLQLDRYPSDEFYTKEEMESKGFVFSEFSPIPTQNIKSISIKCKEGINALVNQYNNNVDKEQNPYIDEFTYDINEKAYKYLCILLRHVEEQIEPFEPSLKDYVDKFTITYTSGESVEL